MTTVNAQVDNDIYVCSRNQYGDDVFVRIEAPNGSVYLSRREYSGKRLFERVLPRHGYINETQSHRLYTRLLQVARIAESKLAAHESTPQGVLTMTPAHEIGGSMTDAEKQIREALAAGPTPGRRFQGRSPHSYCVYDKKCWYEADGSRHGETPNLVVTISPEDAQADAQFIAAASPDNIAALLDEMERLRNALWKACGDDAEIVAGCLDAVTGGSDD